MSFFSSKKKTKHYCKKCGHSGRDFFSKEIDSYYNWREYRCPECGSDKVITKEEALDLLFKKHAPLGKGDKSILFKEDKNE